MKIKILQIKMAGHHSTWLHTTTMEQFVNSLQNWQKKNPEDLYGRTSLKLWNEASQEKGKVITTKANLGLYVHYLIISFINTKVHCSRNVRPTIPLFNLVFSNARTSWRSQQIIKGAALISMQRCTTNFSRKTKVM